MEESGLLDPDDEVDLYALHLVFKPMLQSACKRFQLNWNVHKHRSLHHKSPQWAFNKGLKIMKQVANECGQQLTELDQVTSISIP